MKNPIQLFILLLFIFFASCTKDDEKEPLLNNALIDGVSFQPNSSLIIKYGKHLLLQFSDGEKSVEIITNDTITGSYSITSTSLKKEGPLIANINYLAGSNSYLGQSGIVEITKSENLVYSGSYSANLQSGDGASISISSGNFSNLQASAPPLPVISTISDLLLKIADTMIISGLNFSPVPSENSVKFGEITAPLFESGTTIMKLLVPQNALSGEVTLTVATHKVVVGQFVLIPTIEFIDVAGGTYEKGWYSTVSTTVGDFKIGKYEVKNSEFVAFLNDYGNDVVKTGEGNAGEKLFYENNIGGIIKSGNSWICSTGKSNYPAVQITFFGAKKFAEWYGARLITDDEWEFAARGGNLSEGFNFAGSNLLHEVGWYGYGDEFANAANPNNNMYGGQGTHEVGQLLPNELGIYDMSGNVYEWVNDPSATGNYERLRGGSWRLDNGHCYVGFSSNESEPNDADEDRIMSYGFRIALD
ncbi:MAG: SUMF1/EgtB/PvdO family nonheme iron enzyme [Bacteroidales bacterium]|nr:SUMF1/EgtB/PvdO family nonheme iron enzyme [Bacteroidales bacterium]